MSTEATLDTINNTNLKTVGEAASHSMGLAFENAVAHQAAMNQIRELAIGSLAKKMTELDVSEAAALLKVTSGNDVASQIAALTSALAAGQQTAKVAQTVPPVTP